ncbi:hypothetical protein GCM10008910_25740 [Faecalicatena orotica]|nr:signal peptidase I [Faecalicatena orotica]
MRKAISIIFNVSWVILGIYIIFMEVSPDTVKNVLGYQPFVILTDSMEPVIPTGSVVLVKNLKENEEPKKGDIITFNVDRLGKEAVFTHYYRGTEVQEDGSVRYLTEAALADRYDDYVSHREDIIGTYVFHIPYVGKYALFLKSPFALIELGIIMFIMIIYEILWSKFDKEERKAQEEAEQPEEPKSICSN